MYKGTIGLFGFGVVGEGIYQVLRQTPSLQAVIKKVCIRQADKKRAADAALFTTVYADILEDPDIDIVVELIDDAAEAYKIVTTAMQNGKSVVSANKKMIASHLPELLEQARTNGVSFLYEAAVCGSIPIIRNLEEYYDNDLLKSISGIVNGSTNYILTRVGEGMEYKAALQQAQQHGFAESNPSLDVEGIDAANKLSILLTHAYGIYLHPSKLMHTGISRLTSADAKYAEEKGWKIRLVAQAQKLGAGKVAAFVLPQFVARDNQLYHVDNEFNGVVIESKLADKQFLYGKGAGRFPTSSAVVSDISALKYQYKYEYKKLNRREKLVIATDYFLKIYVSFNNWEDVNRWDFEHLLEYHSTSERQYVTAIIHSDKLKKAGWFSDPSVSVIVLPETITEREAILERSLKKISLQLAGIN